MMLRPEVKLERDPQVAAELHRCVAPLRPNQTDVAELIAARVPQVQIEALYPLDLPALAPGLLRILASQRQVADFLDGMELLRGSVLTGITSRLSDLEYDEMLLAHGKLEDAFDWRVLVPTVAEVRGAEDELDAIEDLTNDLIVDFSAVIWLGIHWTSLPQLAGWEEALVSLLRVCADSIEAAEFAAQP